MAEGSNVNWLIKLRAKTGLLPAVVMAVHSSSFTGSVNKRAPSLFLRKDTQT